MDTQALPNLKELFRDKDIGCAAVHVVDDKFVIHSEIYGNKDRRKLEQVQEINVMIDNTFRDKGVEKLYTWAETDEQYRFNQFLGYKPNGNEISVPDYDKKIYEFEKVLTE